MSDDPAEPDLPEARIVDREGGYSKAARLVGLPLVGAVFTMWSEMLACVLLAALIAKVDGQDFEIFDVAMFVAFGVIAFLLARRIVRPTELDVRLKWGRLDYPSTSWAHAVFDLLYAAFGTAFLVQAQYEPGPAVDPPLCLGLGFTILPGILFVLRVVFWRRQRQINGP